MVNPISTNGLLTPVGLTQPQPQRGDRAQTGQAASGDSAPSQAAALDQVWRAAREAVARRLTSLDLALGAGPEGAAALGAARDAAADGDADAFAQALARYSVVIDSAIAAGAGVLGGEDISVQADPNGPPIVIEGEDFRIGAEAGEIIKIDADATPGAETAIALQDSLRAFQAALVRFGEAAQRLQAHEELLGVAQRSISAQVKPDLDVETARLLALQVSQGLAGANAAIAASESHSVLSLFRA
ncbi:MAG: hypothetical protein GC189_12530 [Alphaproteobacteria bacterium]|nr:hypothetical protein [Alphaproteobacteria bacterium]